METPNLYPLSIGEILDRAFRLYRRHFGLLIGITLAAYVPMTVLKAVSFFLFQTSGIVDWLQSAFISLLVSGALTVAISDLYLGDSVTMKEAYQGIWQRYGAAWGAQFLVGLFIVIPVFLLGCGLSFMLNMRSTGTNLLILILIVPLVSFAATRWSL
ncbi:MAG TPA: hypothetical protein PK530_12315, partial [Anaerolineales bacterium]|nr:hypothetical protein [Anaerolineales bacterium]